MTKREKLKSRSSSGPSAPASLSLTEGARRGRVWRISRILLSRGVPLQLHVQRREVVVAAAVHGAGGAVARNGAEGVQVRVEVSIAVVSTPTIL